MYTLSSRSDGIDTLNFATLYSVVGVDNCNLDSVAESRGLPLARLHLLLKIGEPVFCMTDPRFPWGHIGATFTGSQRYLSVYIGFNTISQERWKQKENPGISTDPGDVLRRMGDSNPRGLAPNTLSKRAP